MSAMFREAVDRFRRLYERACQCGLAEPGAMALATADAAGRPSVRVVLMRGFDDRGFVFFTNSESRKGREMAANPHAALCFYWPPLDEQVRIEGPVEQVGFDEADAYWASRSRDSQLSAWASNQSDRIESREKLEAQVAEYDRRFAAGAVPRPPHWLGYRVVANRFEFWRSQPARLHERTLYERVGDEWQRAWIAP